MAVLGVWRSAKRLLLPQALLDTILARRHRGLNLAGAAPLPRLDLRRVQLVELIDVFDDGGQLIRKGPLLFFRKFKVGQPCDLLYFSSSYRHLLWSRSSRCSAQLRL